MNAMKRIGLAVMIVGVALAAASPVNAARNDSDIHPDVLWTDSIQKQFRATPVTKIRDRGNAATREVFAQGSEYLFDAHNGMRDTTLDVGALPAHTAPADDR